MSRSVQRRRIERGMFLLRSTDRSVTDICFDVGFNSLGTFSRTFQDIVCESPTIRTASTSGCTTRSATRFASCT